MPRSSSGTYTQPGGTTAVGGATIDPTSFNTLVSDLGSEVTNSVDRLGRGGMEADLPMGGFKAVNLADPAAAQDAATKAYADAGDATNATAAAAAQTTANAALPKAGGTMTGAITLAADPAAALQPATKQYVDAVTPTQTSKAGQVLKTNGTSTAWSPLTVTAAASVTTNIALAPTVNFSTNIGTVTRLSAGVWAVTLSGFANANYTVSITGAFYTSVTNLTATPSACTSSGFNITFANSSGVGLDPINNLLVHITVFGGV